MSDPDGLQIGGRPRPVIRPRPASAWNGQEAILDVLAQCRWFRMLSRDELREVYREGVVISLPKGRTVFRTGDTSSDIYILISGRIAISTTGLSGREIGFRQYGPADAFGELAALDGKPRSANAKAMQASQLLRISPSGFRRLLATYPSVAEEVLKSLARLVRALSDRIAENSARAPVRIVGGIVQMAAEAAPAPDTIRVQIHPAPTDEELAARYDSHRESVNRVINELKRRGLVSRSRAALTVLDLPGLRRHLAEMRG
ncbi:Crp/Fnr family transcriptional regulator [Geminicoccus roseus]|uniref:Crp/Fnr family transcriptional regulator n=1 Tax=Geminicoccus roseus TaxID=404900 RepID=UPI000404976D|nr:Crp/Fnr family transcriptional regulator [Geminicoccus roseus]